uniref:Uncharacterized protein LOC117364282 isoform X3 n=1 Tax=Geotrypetes seraphini TaxID=260995 RepID=A0A6P8RUD4_GEOSA|nr:uncharacterized protein LOC117364282 isoform X3 [Geotrypetes seraphini]
MSYEALANGFTAWINVRLFEIDRQFSDIFVELFLDTNLKLLLESLTGETLQKMKSLDELTEMQIYHQVKWFVEEVKKHEIIAKFTKIDYWSVAQRRLDKVLNLLWNLIVHDICFTWERYVQLLHAENKVVCSVPLKWTPKVPPADKKQPMPESTLNLIAILEDLSRKSKSSIINMEAPAEVDFEPYPGHEKAKEYNTKIPKQGRLFYPPPKKCILDQINELLQMTSAGQKHLVKRLEDLWNSHVMCNLLNAFLPGCFTTEIILNDRWATSLAIKTLDNLLHISSSFSVDDLHEANLQAVCAYMCSICMAGYKYRQSKAVVNSVKKLNLEIQLTTYHLEEFSAEKLGLQEFVEQMNLKAKRQELENELSWLKSNYDLEFCERWVMHAYMVRENLTRIILKKKRDRFEIVRVPRSMALRDFCLSMGINLLLTKGNGFYQTNIKESLLHTRKIVLLKKETGEFFDDFSGVPSNAVRNLLNLPTSESIEVDSNVRVGFQLFFETKSKNKVLKANSLFLYQVFPGTNAPWHEQLLRAVKVRDHPAVKNLLFFFMDAFPEAINFREPSSGNTALHYACQIGCSETVELLLENGALVNTKNKCGHTPFFLAVQSYHRNICKLLIEWGCDLHDKDNRNQTAMDVIRNEEMKNFIIGHSSFCSSMVKSVLEGKMEKVQMVVERHKQGNKLLQSLQSRCIDGSTLLHVAAYFGERDLIKELLDLKVNVNVLDYKGATALHRCRDKKTVQLLLSYGADINWIDFDGNSALHKLSYEATGEKDQLDCLQFLLSFKSSEIWNKKGLLPIQCAAMQGRTEVIQLMLEGNENVRKDTEEILLKSQTLSPLYLAVANGHLECAKWLASKSFTLNPGEGVDLMFSILFEDVNVKDNIQTLDFLAKSGVKLDTLSKNGNSVLHLAALRNETYEILTKLLSSGAYVEVTDIEQRTPLFYSIFAINLHGASLLIDYDVYVGKSPDASPRTKTLKGTVE